MPWIGDEHPSLLQPVRTASTIGRGLIVSRSGGRVLLGELSLPLLSSDFCFKQTSAPQVT